MPSLWCCYIIRQQQIFLHRLTVWQLSWSSFETIFLAYVSVGQLKQQIMNHHKQFRVFIVISSQYVDAHFRHFCHFCLALLLHLWICRLRTSACNICKCAESVFQVVSVPSDLRFLPLKSQTFSKSFCSSFTPSLVSTQWLSPLILPRVLLSPLLLVALVNLFILKFHNAEMKDRVSVEPACWRTSPPTSIQTAGATCHRTTRNHRSDWVVPSGPNTPLICPKSLDSPETVNDYCQQGLIDGFTMQRQGKQVWRDNEDS